MSKNVYSAAVGWNALYMSASSIWSKVFKFTISLLILCLDDLSIVQSGILKSSTTRTFLVAQWLTIRLPTQGTRVQEDPTCRGATKPVRHDYWACALEPASHNYWAHMPQLLKPARLEPTLHNKRSHRNEKPAHCKTKNRPQSLQLKKARAQQQRPNTAKNKLINFLKSPQLLLCCYLFPLLVLLVCAYIFRCSYGGCLNIYKYYTFLTNWPLLLYDDLFVSCHHFWSPSCLI